MLSEEQVKKLPERLVKRLETINILCLEKIGQRIKEIGAMSPSDVHRLTAMIGFGADVREITQELANVTAKNTEEIYEIYDLVAKDNYAFAKTYYETAGKAYIAYESNKHLQKYVKAQADITAKEYVQLSQHTAFMVIGKDGKKRPTSLSDTYTKVIDMAVEKVALGVSDYQSEMRGALKALADSGLRTKYTPLKGRAGKTVDYATGYSRRLDTAVRQNVLWGVKQLNQGMQEQTGQEFGADGWEIDYHSNPRPSHAAMGGRQYAAGKARTVNGVYYPSFSTVEDLMQDYGCLHFKWAIILGVSEPNYSPEELKKLKELDKATIEFEGEEYTRYELSQIQRKLETAARHAKDRQIIAKAAGDDELRRREQERINLITSKYAKVSKAAGLPTKAERMRVSGYHRVKTLEELDPNLTFIKNQVKIKAESGLPKKLKGLPDEKIKATADVNLPKINGVVPKGADATNVTVMAGSGTSTAIRDVKRLYAQYPKAGKPENWQKKTSDVFTDNYKYVVHWYENNGFVPEGEIKTKGVKKL